VSASVIADSVQITAFRSIDSAFAIDLFYIELRKVSAGRESAKSRAYLYTSNPCHAADIRSLYDPDFVRRQSPSTSAYAAGSNHDRKEPPRQQRCIMKQCVFHRA
jgi:hypothetical protein